jgi:hypothetical protein
MLSFTRVAVSRGTLSAEDMVSGFLRLCSGQNDQFTVLLKALYPGIDIGGAVPNQLVITDTGLFAQKCGAELGD